MANNPMNDGAGAIAWPSYPSRNGCALAKAELKATWDAKFNITQIAKNDPYEDGEQERGTDNRVGRLCG
jgi:hypothetical protein